MFAKIHRILPVLALSCVLIGLCKPGHAQTTLYDDFNSTFIDPAKWLGFEAVGFETLDTKREIATTPGVKGDRRLHLSRRSYAPTTDDAGYESNGYGLLFPAPASITSVALNVVVNAAKAVECTASSASAGASAGFAGTFFNPSGSPNGATGDVTAYIAVIRSSPDGGKGLTVGVAYYQCDDAACDSTTILFSQSLGVVQPGSSNTLALKWDKANHQFVYQLNGNSPVTATYTLGDSFPPSTSYRYISINESIPHCTSTPRPYANMSAYFDNVYVNP